MEPGVVIQNDMSTYVLVEREKLWKNTIIYLVLENMMYGYNVRSVQRNINLIYQKEYVLGS